MTLDFFADQSRARRWTALLILLFSLGLLAVVAAVCMAMMVVLVPLSMFDSLMGSPWPDRVYVWGFSITAVVTASAVLIASWWKIRSLRKGGGMALAESLGGVLVPPDTTDPGKRKLLNVVEEMAIASGLPVPPVYLLEQEEGINAFAAGWEPVFAVLGVTQGAVDMLSRDELQGVMGHEFSHVFNGDMRLNLRLVGLVHGIMILGLTGRGLMKASVGGGHDVEGKVFAPGVALGAALAVIGYGGYFFGLCIKAAVSRQREFLADASAVQFTRNPGSVCDALLKIGGFAPGSTVTHPMAPMLSHMFFGRGVSGFFESLLSTHPPILVRIQRLDPSFVPEFPEVNEATRRMIASQDLAEVAGFATQDYADAPMQGPGASALDSMHELGALKQEYVHLAQEIIRSLPPEVRNAARRSDTAPAVIHGLLILHHTGQDAGQAPGLRDTLMDLLLELTDLATYDATARLLPFIETVPARGRMPLVDLCIPALREMTHERHKRFKATVKQLIRADKRMDLMEWALTRVLMRHLDPWFQLHAKAPAPRFLDIKQVAGECALLLAMLARLGLRDRSARQRAFAQGAQALGLDLTPPPAQDLTLSRVNQALDALNGLDRHLKGRLLKACARCIAQDKEVTVEQGEMLRAVADSLGCPMPPILPGQSLE